MTRSGRRRARDVVSGTLAALAIAVACATAAAEGAIEGLKRGVRDARPEVRVAAILDAARAASALDDDERRKVALVLRKVLEADPAPAVRLEAVRTLARLRDEAAWIPVIAAALSDRDDLVRAAANEAVLVARGNFVDVAAKLLREDQDPTFRAETALLLGRRRRLDAVPALLLALGDPHPRVATAAAEALEAVSGKALGYEASAWRSWWETAKPGAAAPAPAMGGDTVTREPEAPKAPPPPPPSKGLVPDLFGVPLASKDLVVLVDVSGSIGASGFESAKSALVRSVERLPSDVRLAALFFDETVHAWHPEMTLATPSAKADLARFVRGIPRGKRTDVMTPLNAGLAIVRRRIEEKKAAKEPFAEPVTMIVVSDGQENVRETPGDSVGEKLDALDLALAVVHAIVVGGKDSALMAALARRAGGRYLVLP